MARFFTRWPDVNLSIETYWFLCVQQESPGGIFRAVEDSHLQTHIQILECIEYIFKWL